MDHKHDGFSDEVDEALDRLFDMNDEERDVELERLKAADPKLHDEVASLLWLEDEAAKLIGESVAEHLSTELDAVEADLADALVEGDLVGPYRVAGLIGRGGMGSVYHARREDIDRDVALKIIRRGMDTTDILRRFESERRILAGLDHPNIARLLDAGATAEGLPYFVMEYVDGLPIDVYCDQHRLSISERLKLFRDVCEAVQHAHRNLIIHRDLKPANILVNRDGTAKLLDFGIAKALHDDGPEFVQTEAFRRALTPQYASPEQFGESLLTTASDVYGLGILLYELLAGQRPFEIARRQREEAARIILEEVPTKPSTVVQDHESAALSRRSTSQRLSKRLRGDLDNIVLKALRKKPEDRYVSAEQFSADIARHLEGQPVLAQRPTVGYRVSRFVARHRAGVSVAAFILLMVAVFMSVLVRQNTQVVKERDRAQLEARKAEEVSAFVQGLFEWADPDALLSDTLRVRTVLKQGTRRIEDELVGQPEVRSELMTLMGQIYVKLALFDEAEPLLRQALSSRLEVYGPSSVEVGETQEIMASLLNGRAAYAAADSLLQEALSTARLIAPNGSLVSDILRTWGHTQEMLGHFDRSEELFKEAVAIRRGLPNGDPLLLADLLGNMGDMLRKKSDFEGAEAVLIEALTIYRGQHGSDYTGSVIIEHNLAHVVENKGEYERANAMYRATVPKLKYVYGDNHPTVATVYNNIAGIEGELGNFAEADSTYRLAMQMYRESLGDNHPYVGIVMNNIAYMYGSMGEYQKAAAGFEEALAFRKGIYAPDHPDVGLAYFNLGRARHLLGEHGLATELMETSLRILEGSLDENHIRIVRARSGLGDCLTAQGRFEAAEAQLVPAYDSAIDQLGSEHPTTKLIIERLVALNEAWNRPGETARYRALMPDSATADVN